MFSIKKQELKWLPRCNNKSLYFLAELVIGLTPLVRQFREHKKMICHLMQDIPGCTRDNFILRSQATRGQHD